MSDATILAGNPDQNMTLYHAIRFLVGDPTVLITSPDGSGKTQRTLILRDIEMKRARAHARVDAVHCPDDFAPASGLSAERETATAQAAAVCLSRLGANRVKADRTLPLIYVHHIEQAGIEVVYDEAMGVADRRAKDEAEVEMLRAAQGATEEAMRMACEMVARAEVGAGGDLMRGGSALTSERVSSAIDVFLLERGYSTPMNIVAGGREGSDCHNRGSGELRTGEPVIIDIFPQNKRTLYNGDCTRTVVNGDVPDEFGRMHAAVVEAKAAGTNAIRAGVTCDAVYRAAMDVIERHGWGRGILADDGPVDACSMQHGLGHGIGLNVHEAPLVDEGGPELVVGDALTIEPGLYHATIGGVRIEDMVIVRADGCENLNRLPEGLDWR
jgi:Xaa-Pro aminopeptidase